MTWIHIIDENESTGALSELYEKITGKRGKVANIMKAHSLNPKSMENHLELYMTLMFGKSNLSRAEREMIAVVVSSINNCEYCISHHAKALNHLWRNNEKTQRLMTDYKTCTLSEKNKNMLHYAVKITKNPSSVSKKDIDNLKTQGFSDADILDINLISSYFNFVNRIALGLGVNLNKDEEAGYLY